MRITAARSWETVVLACRWKLQWRCCDRLRTVKTYLRTDTLNLLVLKEPGIFVSDHEQVKHLATAEREVVSCAEVDNTPLNS
jgi:hypothetical protein